MRKIFLLLSLMVAVAVPAAASPCVPAYDLNGDGVFNQDDPKFLLVYLFLNGAAPVCDADANGDGNIDTADAVFMIDILAAAACSAATVGDVDDNGLITLVDAIHLLNYLFLGGDAPKPCDDVGDVNGDDVLNVADAVALINVLDCPGIPGDSNSDELVDAVDANIILEYLFNGGDEPFPCLAAGDFDEDGDVDMGDAIGILNQ